MRPRILFWARQRSQQLLVKLIPSQPVGQHVGFLVTFPPGEDGTFVAHDRGACPLAPETVLWENHVKMVAICKTPSFQGSQVPLKHSQHCLSCLVADATGRQANEAMLRQERSLCVQGHTPAPECRRFIMIIRHRVFVPDHGVRQVQRVVLMSREVHLICLSSVCGPRSQLFLLGGFMGLNLDR